MAAGESIELDKWHLQSSPARCGKLRSRDHGKSFEEVPFQCQENYGEKEFDKVEMKGAKDDMVIFIPPSTTLAHTYYISDVDGNIKA
ncbi:MAG: hypothetical protein IPM04_01655 [Saprospiraceae bacterium]|nr:hypothetical protein [Candidatus Brachybacter algidus]MBK8746588.1 hypothetical protein [Candidatus Brachybacter algidus]